MGQTDGFAASPLEARQAANKMVNSVRIESFYGEAERFKDRPQSKS